MLCGKQAPLEEEHEPRSRMMRLMDVIGLGLGGPLALGIFVLVGFVAETMAGPSVLLSVIVAALVALMAGLCYVEFSTLYPDTRGSASYVITYCASSELLAFIVGWNLIFEYIVGAAAASRGIRAALDSLLNGTLSSSFLDVAPLNENYASPYVDFMALLLPLLAAGLLLLTSQNFAAPKVAVSLLTVATVLFVIVTGAIKADGDNWALRPEEAPEEALPGNGGFVPFGFMGVLRGAAVIMHSFVGLDHIAASGRMTKGEPSVAPWGLGIVLITTMLGVLGVGVVLTLMVPFYNLDRNAALVTVFSSLGWPEAQWIVCVSAILALSLTVVGGTAASARLLRSLAEDGLLWPHLQGEERGCGRNTPLYATLAVATLAGLMGAFFEEHQLASVLSIGIMLSFVALQISLILHRCGFEPGHKRDGTRARAADVLRQLRPRLPHKQEQPSRATAMATRVALLFFCLSGAGLAAMALNGGESLQQGDTWSVVLIVVFAVLCMLAFASLIAQPQSPSKAAFKVPLVPVLPCIGILSCKFLVATLHLSEAWIRFGVWTIIGLAMYAACRVCRSRQLHAATVLSTGTSTPPHLDSPRRSEGTPSGFSLDVEECSVSIVSSTHSRHVQHQARDTRTGSAAAAAWLQEAEFRIKGPPASPEHHIFEENRVAYSSPGEFNPVEEMKKEPEVKEMDAPVTESHNGSRAHNDMKSDIEYIEIIASEEVFDVKKFNSIWNTNDLSDDDSETSSRIDETVAQIHESSTEEETATKDENLATENEISYAVECSMPYAAMVESAVPIVVQLPDAVAANEESTSDEDSLTSLGDTTLPKPSPLPKWSPPVPPPLSSLPPPLPSSPCPLPPVHHSSDIFSEEPPLEPAPSFRVSVPPTTSRPPVMRDLQEELKTTLRLRNQKKIEQIENTAINVSEGIEIFGGGGGGGKRSRTTSLNKGDSDVNNSVKSAMRAGKFEDPNFVYKLNNILQGQVARPGSEQKRKAPTVPSSYSRQKDVVLVDQAEAAAAAAGNREQRPEGRELAARMQQMRSTLEQILLMSDSRRASSRLSDTSERSSLNTAPSLPRPPSRVHKSLDSLGPTSDMQIVSRQ